MGKQACKKGHTANSAFVEKFLKNVLFNENWNVMQRLKSNEKEHACLANKIKTIKIYYKEKMAKSFAFRNSVKQMFI